MIDVIKQELLTPYYEFGFYNAKNADFIGYMDEESSTLIPNPHKPEYKDVCLKDLRVVEVVVSVF